MKVVLKGDIDLETKEELREQLHEAALAGGGVELDLSAVTFLDSSGLAVIAELIQALDERGDRVTLAGATGTVRRTLEIVGFGEMADLVDQGLPGAAGGSEGRMSDLNDDDITSEPTEDDENLDTGGGGPADTGDEPTEADEDRDAGGEGAADTGDEA